MSGKGLPPSGTRETPSSTIAWGDNSSILQPWNSTIPARGASMPEMALRSVVLPAPLAPIRATISASPTARETLHNAWTLI